MRKRKVIGIDMGTHALKVVQFSVSNKGRAVLEKSACLPWSLHDKKRNGDSRELKSHLAACSISRGASCSALNDPSLLVRRMSLPPMPAGEMRDVLQFKLRKEMNSGPEDLVVDYLPLDRARSPSQPLQSLMVFALHRNALEAHLRFLEGAGIKPVSVEPSSTALTHLLEGCPVLQADGCSLLLDLGLSGTCLILVEDKRPVFIRAIPFSGKQLTQSIREGLQVDAKKAEDWKRSVGLSPPEGTDPESGAVPEILGPLVEDLVSEIQYSLGYVQDQRMHAPSVHRIILTGGGAGMPGLAEALERAFQLPCRPLPDLPELGLNVSEGFISFGQPATSSSLATALGLALREVRG